MTVEFDPPRPGADGKLRERAATLVPEKPKAKGNGADAVGWPAPKPLPDGLLPVAAFDRAFLPEIIAPWVMDISDRMQCPPDFVAIPAIVALGSVIGRKSCGPATAKNRLVRGGKSLGLHRRAPWRDEVARDGRSAEAYSQACGRSPQCQ